jgi:hypothetical protein
MGGMFSAQIPPSRPPLATLPCRPQPSPYLGGTGDAHDSQLEILCLVRPRRVPARRPGCRARRGPRAVAAGRRRHDRDLRADRCRHEPGGAAGRAGPRGGQHRLVPRGAGPQTPTGRQSRAPAARRPVRPRRTADERRRQMGVASLAGPLRHPSPQHAADVRHPRRRQDDVRRRSASSSTAAGSRSPPGRPSSSKPSSRRQRGSRRRGIWPGRWGP